MTIRNINVSFKTNVLSLNLDKTNFMHSITKNSSCIDKNVGYENKLISNTSNLKFLRLITDDTRTWKSPIEGLYQSYVQLVLQLRWLNMRHLKNYILFLFSFNYKLWFNILGKFLIQHYYF